MLSPVGNDVVWDSVFCEDVAEKELGKSRCVECFGGGDEDRHFRESIDDYENAVEVVTERESFYEVHGYGSPWSVRDGKEAKWAIGFVSG